MARTYGSPSVRVASSSASKGTKHRGPRHRLLAKLAVHHAIAPRGRTNGLSRRENYLPTVRSMTRGDGLRSGRPDQTANFSWEAITSSHDFRYWQLGGNARVHSKRALRLTTRPVLTLDRRLTAETREPLRRLGVAIMFVLPDGRVEQSEPGQRPLEGSSPISRWDLAAIGRWQAALIAIMGRTRSQFRTRGRTLRSAVLNRQ